MAQVNTSSNRQQSASGITASSTINIGEATGSKVFTLKPYESLTSLLAQTLLSKYKDNPLELASTLIILPTSRSIKTLKDEFIKFSCGSPFMLPKMLTVSNLEDTADFANEIIPPSISPMERNILLASLILSNPNSFSSGECALDDAFRLAKALGRFLDDIESYDVDINKLHDIVPDEFAFHWQKVLDFLKIITEAYPKELEKLGKIDTVIRRKALIKAKVNSWQENPVSFPVISAGVAGILPETAALLKGILALPFGQVILRPFGKELGDEVWNSIDETHYAYQGKTLLNMIGVRREEVRYFNDNNNDNDNTLAFPSASLSSSNQTEQDLELLHTQQARAEFISTAFYSSTITDKWQNYKVPLAGLKGLHRVNSETISQEATAAALILRHTLEEQGKEAIFVTADKALAKRTAGIMQRWGIDIEDSSGQELIETGVGIFLCLAAEAGVEGFSYASLLPLLKHPLAGAGQATRVFHKEVCKWEKSLRSYTAKPNEALVSLPLSENMYSDFASLFTSASNVPFTALLDKHLKFAEALASTDEQEGSIRLWQDDDGELAAQVLSEMAKFGAALGSIRPADYALLFKEMLRGYILRKNYKRHPRLDIIGPLEARLQTADVIIIGGLNEGTYPALPEPNPWLSRLMAKRIGLPDSQVQIGIEEADFFSFLFAKEVYLLNSAKIDGAPAVPSRWLFRMDALLENVKEEQVYGDTLLSANGFDEISRKIDIPAYEEIKACSRPEPRPPSKYRPKRLSVTEIERFMRDPYSIYAKHVLHLSPLKDIDEEKGISDYGNAVHKVFEDFIKQYGANVPEDAYNKICDIGDKVFRDMGFSGSALAFWKPVFARSAEWFLQEQQKLSPLVKKIIVEEKRTITFPLKKSNGEIDEFTLSGRFDRIDVLKDGGIKIIDYKTGEISTQKAVKALFSPQLPLEALMIRLGAFADIGVPKNTEVSSLEYWKLSGKATGSYRSEVLTGEELVMQKSMEVYDKLLSWLTRYNEESTPYYASPRMSFQLKYSDYEHLERIKEWSVKEDPEDEETEE